MNIKETINKIIPEDIKVKLKEHLAKFSETAPVVEPVAPTENVKMANEVKLADGTSLSIDGDVAVGSPVKLVSPDGLLDAADGEYVAEDGNVYTVMNGAIAEIATKEEEAPEAPETANSEMPTMMAAIESLTKEVAALKVALSEQKESVKLTLSAVNTIIDTPVVEPVEAVVEFEKMTPFQRYKLSKQNG